VSQTAIDIMIQVLLLPHTCFHSPYFSDRSTVIQRLTRHMRIHEQTDKKFAAQTGIVDTRSRLFSLSIAD
jgi:hypothetical protein